MTTINTTKRYQVGLRLIDLFPDRKDGLCACGCQCELRGKKKRWASLDCQEYAVTILFIIKGDRFTIRKLLYQRDQGYCQHCGVLTENWEADHILPVHLGGGACDLDNYQTLCKGCHKSKSYTESHLNTISSQAASILPMRRFIAEGAVSYVLLKQSIEIQALASTFSSSSIMLEQTY